jgi:hypothetical protein
MTEPTRSFWLGEHATSWEDLPRWQRLSMFWAALLLAVAFCLKIGQIETLLILTLAMLAGRLAPTLFDLRATGRGSARPQSVVERP